MMLAVLSVLMCAGAAAGAGGRGAATLAAPALFAVETTVLVNDVARNDRELGYRLKARLAVRPLHRDRDTLLLEFRLIAPALHLRGKHRNAEYLPRPSLWDDLGEASFFAHWEAGAVRTAYLDPREPLDVLNYKRSIISLFQFNSEDGDYKETDVSGDCDILYETISETVFRKTKEACACDAAPATLRRVSRYTLAAAGGPLAAVHAEELATVGDAALGLKARAWHALAALPPPAAAAAAPQAPSLEAALAALPAPLAPAPLPLAAPLAPAADANADAEDFDDHLEAARGEGEGDGEGAAGAGGDAATAEAALRLAAALRRAPEWGAGVGAGAGEGRARALGASGTRAALAAADAVVQLRARDAPPALAAAYLEAFALGGAPEAAAVAEVLRVGEEAASAAVRASALLAAAAAAATRAAAGDAAASAAVRDSLLRSLARCKEEECAAVRLRALANLRRADTVEALLEHARRGAAAPVAALAALDALAAAPARALAPHLGRVAAVALDARAPLDVRAAALQLALAGWARVPLPHPIARMAAALLDDEHEHEHELRRLFWQRLRAIAARSAAVRELLPRLRPRLRGWHALALNGTSSVLQRDVGWEAAGWRAALDSAQLVRGGLLRRGEVRLFATDARGRDADLVSVEMWTRGMEALAGAEGGGGDGDGAGGPAPAAGLAFSVRGVRMRGVTLFDGQAELLGHVWSGTGSAPTPALRATLPLEERRATLPLLAGVALRVAWRAGAAVAIDAHAQVSLWWRTAHAALELRAALVAQAHARLATAWGEVRASTRSTLEPHMHIGADADFYDAVALCVRVRSADHRGARNATLRSELGARRLRVARERRAAVAWPGRTLALGAPNDGACRTLRAADAPETPEAPDA